MALAVAYRRPESPAVCANEDLEGLYGGGSQVFNSPEAQTKGML
jgi:hypothetical protein